MEIGTPSVESAARLLNQSSQIRLGLAERASLKSSARLPRILEIHTPQGRLLPSSRPQAGQSVQ